MVKGLGRGLSALFSDTEEAYENASSELGEGTPAAGATELPVDALYPNPDQPRKYFNENAQKELEESIKVHGVLQPLILAKRGDGFVIVAGERRYRAAKAIGMSSLPAIVKQIDDSLMREISLIEN